MYIEKFLWIAPLWTLPVLLAMSMMAKDRRLVLQLPQYCITVKKKRKGVAAMNILKNYSRRIDKSMVYPDYNI